MIVLDPRRDGESTSINEFDIPEEGESQVNSPNVVSAAPAPKGKKASKGKKAEEKEPAGEESSSAKASEDEDIPF